MRAWKEQRLLAQQRKDEERVAKLRKEIRRLEDKVRGGFCPGIPESRSG